MPDTIFVPGTFTNLTDLAQVHALNLLLQDILDRLNVLDVGTVTANELADNSVLNTKLRDSVGVSVIGRGANSTGDPADIVAAANGRYLQRNGNVVSFAAIAEDDLPAGGFKHVPGLWEQANVAATQTDVVLLLNANNTEVVLPYAGSVIAISVAATEARTAGTLTVEATIDGTKIGLSAVLDATNTQFAFTTQAKDTDAFTAGQRLGVVITTTGTWTPTTSDVIVGVWVEL